jgi:hypothetical protein
MDFQPMSPGEIQRTMQFLLDHQTKFVVDFDRVSERVDKLADTTDRIADSTLGVTAVLDQLIATQQATNQRVDRLHDVFVHYLCRDHGDTGV